MGLGFGLELGFGLGFGFGFGFGLGFGVSVSVTGVQGKTGQDRQESVDSGHVDDNLDAVSAFFVFAVTSQIERQAQRCMHIPYRHYIYIYIYMQQGGIYRTVPRKGKERKGKERKV